MVKDIWREISTFDLIDTRRSYNLDRIFSIPLFMRWAGMVTSYFCLFEPLITSRRNWSSSRWYEQSLEQRLNVLRKFLLFRTVSHASHFSISLLELDVLGLTNVKTGFLSVAGSWYVVFDWVVFDLVRGFNTLVDGTKRLFRGALVVCISSTVGSAPSVMSVAHCTAVVRTDRVSW